MTSPLKNILMDEENKEGDEELGRHDHPKTEGTGSSNMDRCRDEHTEIRIPM